MNDQDIELSLRLQPLYAQLPAPGLAGMAGRYSRAKEPRQA